MGRVLGCGERSSDQAGKLRYENQLIVAEGDYVIAHGRFSGNGRPAAWIAADVIRFEDGKLAEASRLRRAERFWSDRYIQHSAHIAPGRTGLFDCPSAGDATGHSR